jgi:hypothetical protein
VTGLSLLEQLAQVDRSQEGRPRRPPQLERTAEREIDKGERRGEERCKPWIVANDDGKENANRHERQVLRKVEPKSLAPGEVWVSTQLKCDDACDERGVQHVHDRSRGEDRKHASQTRHGGRHVERPKPFESQRASTHVQSGLGHVERGLPP